MAEQILLVCPGDKAAEALTAFLKGGQTVVQRVADAGEARRRVQQALPDVALVYAPLPDELGDSLAVDLAGMGVDGVILIAGGEAAGEIADRVEPKGVLVLPRPVSRAALQQSLRLARVTAARLAALRAENTRLERRLAELRVVDRAKCALIQYRGLTEPEAHHFIEREAMDSRITRKQVAEEILRTFEG